MTAALAAALFAVTTLAPDVSVRELKEGVWLHLTRSSDGIDSNGLVVKLGGEALLVDTPWDDRQTELVVDWAAKSLAPVKTAIVTHAHRDRIGGIAALKARGIRALALDLTVEHARADGRPLPDAVVSLTKPVLDDARGFQVFYPGPGHTVDNIVVWFPALRVLHGGCLVKSTDAQGMGYIGEADLKDWPGAIQLLKQRYPSAEIVVPGHGLVGGPAALDKTIALIRAHLAQ